MLRATRPFDRWFDLSDAYDDVPPTVPTDRRKPEPREWTYAPARPQRPAEPKPQPTR